MKIRVFQSDKGDCLLVTSASGTHRVLVDGGTTASYTAHVAPALGKLAKEKKALDAVYVSHIDDDHIAGVLRMMDDLMDWRVFDFQSKHGNNHVKEPTSHRPPEVGKIWHNAFHELLGDNVGPITDMLAASSSILGSNKRALSNGAFLEQSELALSKNQALQLVHRVSGEQLDIAVNPEFKQKLMVIKSGSPKLAVGSMRFSIIGPFEQDLKKLRDEWNQWLRDNQEIVADIRRKAKADKDLLTSDVDRLLAPITAHSEALLSAQLAFAKGLGNRGAVTTPNLASLMFLVMEGDQKILLTGDGHADDAIKGLEHLGELKNSDGLHVNVIKVPHHGSEHNMTPEFAERVTADHYIFCGNGFSTNPEIDVIDLLVNKRREAFPKRPFTLWFNSTSALSKKYAKHMKAVEKNVDAHVKNGGDKVRAKRISGSFMDVSLG
jgi:hypothetical protein